MNIVSLVLLNSFAKTIYLNRKLTDIRNTERTSINKPKKKKAK